MKIIALTPWEEWKDPVIGDVIRPLIGAYKFAWMVDVTHQVADRIIPNPNLAAIQGECDDAEVARIASDPRFKVIHRDTDRLIRPTTAERTALRTYLTNNGVTLTDLNTLVTTTRTREQLGEALRTWLRDRPKAADGERPEAIGGTR